METRGTQGRPGTCCVPPRALPAAALGVPQPRGRNSVAAYSEFRRRTVAEISEIVEWLSAQDDHRPSRANTATSNSATKQQQQQEGRKRSASDGATTATRMRADAAFAVRVRVDERLLAGAARHAPGVLLVPCEPAQTTVARLRRAVHQHLAAARAPPDTASTPPPLPPFALLDGTSTPPDRRALVATLPSVCAARARDAIPCFTAVPAALSGRSALAATLSAGLLLPQGNPEEKKKEQEQEETLVGLQVRVPAGGQVLNLRVPWGTTWAQLRDGVLPAYLRARFPALDQHTVGVRPPARVHNVYAAAPALEGSAPFAALCRRCRVVPHVLLVPLTQEAAADDRCINGEIAALVERPDAPAAAPDDPNGTAEVAHFRAAARRLRCELARARPAGPDLPRFLCSLPFAATDASYVAVELPLRQVAKTLPIVPQQSADSLAAVLFYKYYERVAPGRTQDDFVLKMKGLNSFVYGNVPLVAFTHVHERLVRGERPEMVLVERARVAAHVRPAASPAQVEVFDAVPLLELPDEGPVFRHDDIALRAVPWARRTVVSAWDVRQPLRVRVASVVLPGAEQHPHHSQQQQDQGAVDSASSSGLFCGVQVSLFHGNTLLAPSAWTVQRVSMRQQMVWDEWLTLNIPVMNIPEGARLCFTVWSFTKGADSNIATAGVEGTESSGNTESSNNSSTGKTPIGGITTTLYSFLSELKTGIQTHTLWPGVEADPVRTIAYNCVALHQATRLTFEVASFPLPVVYPTQCARNKTESAGTKTKTTSTATTRDNEELEKLMKKDSLYPLNEEEKRLLWEHREEVAKAPGGLPKVLRAMDWTNSADVGEGYRLLETVEMAPLDAIELFESTFADRRVRSYAARCMESMATDDVLDCLLELTQAVKFEAYHASELAFFLLRSALRDGRVGHMLYWSLKCDVAYAESRPRAALMMDAFLRGCNGRRMDFVDQETFLHALREVAREIKPMRDSERQAHLERRLAQVAIPPGLVLPLNQEFHIGGIDVARCGYKDSSKLPLYIVLTNAEAGCEPFHLIFKEGDDLRQDCLTLQMIRLMDKMWRAAGLDLEMSPYRTLCVGATTGLIEVVRHAKTTAEITKTAGGATAAFKQSPIANWLRQHNRADAVYARCCRRFALSCAGYCVATYVLGICDRHNDNIMVQTSGKFLHIDFGHFLGHKKTWLGFNREPAAFVFTPDFAYVMGGKGAPLFDEFVRTACRAYCIVRRHSSTFINLFGLVCFCSSP